MPHIENIRMFVRVYDLGSMSEAARDQRVSPAVASSRIAKLEKHLGVRLFNRTTRRIHVTEHGQAYYEGATKILQAIEEAEAAVATIANNPRGSIFVAAPLGVGKRFIAPNVPPFKKAYPEINVRLRMSDRNIDLTKEGIDVAFHLGTLKDSALRMQKIADCPRVLCASPDYIAHRGMPTDGQALIDDEHDCSKGVEWPTSRYSKSPNISNPARWCPSPWAHHRPRPRCPVSIRTNATRTPKSSCSSIS